MHQVLAAAHRVFTASWGIFPCSTWTLAVALWLSSCAEACGNLVPQPGIEPTPPALKVWNLKHRPTREAPVLAQFSCQGGVHCLFKSQNPPMPWGRAFRFILFFHLKLHVPRHISITNLKSTLRWTTLELCKILIAAEILSLCHLNPLHEIHSYGDSEG